MHHIRYVAIQVLHGCAGMCYRGVLPPGKCIRGHMLFPRNMFNFEPVHHGFKFEVHYPGVGDGSKFLLVAQDRKKRFVIYTQNKCVEAKDEKFAFFKTCYAGQSFPFNRVVSGLCRGAESATTVDCLPS